MKSKLFQCPFIHSFIFLHWQLCCQASFCECWKTCKSQINKQTHKQCFDCCSCLCCCCCCCKSTTDTMENVNVTRRRRRRDVCCCRSHPTSPPCSLKINTKMSAHMRFAFKVTHPPQPPACITPYNPSNFFL